MALWQVLGFMNSNLAVIAASLHVKSINAKSPGRKERIDGEGCEIKFFEPFASAGMSVKLVYGFLDKTAGASGKAALPRTHSKTWRRFGSESCARSVVECGTPVPLWR